MDKKYKWICPTLISVDFIQRERKVDTRAMLLVNKDILKHLHESVAFLYVNKLDS